MATTEIPTAVTIQGYEPLHESTIRGWMAVGVGFLLMGLTAFCAWVAYGDLPSDVPRPTLAPWAFVLVSGGPFGGAGLYLLWVGIRDVGSQLRANRLRAIHPDEPWRWDFAWNPGECEDISLPIALRGVIGLALAIGIIGPINYFVFTDGAPIFGVVGVLFFDAVLSLSLGTVVYRIAAQVIHGRSRVRFDQFPLRLGEPIRLALVPHAPLDGVEELRCTLRCVQEQSLAVNTGNTTGSPGPGVTVRKMGLQRYAAETTIANPQQHGQRIELQFELPDLPQLSTRLSEEASLHWELLVEGERPGVDFSKRFLLPVY